MVRIGIAVLVALVALAPPALADDEIEMEPDPPKKDPPKKDEPKKVEPSPKVEPAKEPPKVEPKKVEPKNEAKKDDAKPDEPKPEVVKDPKLAKKLVATAQISVQKGDYLSRIKRADDAKKEYELAHAAFTKAVELGDDPNVYLELALVDEKLGKLADAAIHCRVVIKATAGVRPDVLKKATTKYEEVIAKVGLLTLAVKPDGAAISLAGAEIGKSPLPLPLILMPGTYAFSFSADGHQPKEFEVKVEAGSESERGVDLEPIKVTIDTKPVVAEETPVAKPKGPSKIPLFAGVGATGGLFVASIITGSLALGKQHTFAGATTPSGERQDARSSGRTLAHVTDAMLVGTLVAGGFTAYWWYFKYRPAQRKLKEGPAPTPTRKSDDPLHTKIDVAPWVQSDAGGVLLGGRF